MTPKQIIVLGAGAIGSTYGALLSKGNDVTLIGNKTHVKHIQMHGLDLIDERKQNFKLIAKTEINQIHPNTLILLSTKTQDSIPALKQIKSILRTDSAILVLQNGLGIEFAVKEIAGKTEVFRGVTEIAAEFLAPGKIRYWNGKTILAESKSANEVAGIFTNVGLETCISEKMNEEIWRKLILNCVVNPLSALFQVRNNEILDKQLEWVRWEIVHECAAVAKEAGVDIFLNPSKIDNKIRCYHNFSSMCQDILKRKKTEIDFLNGEIVKLGKKHNISTPVNQTITRLVKFLEKKTIEV